MRKHIVPDVIVDQDIATLPSTATVHDAASLMRERGVKSVLVTRANKLVGIITVTDIVNRAVAKGLDPKETKLSKIMTKEPKTVDASATPAKALRVMQDGKFWHIPVVSGEEIVGVVSRSNFEGCDMVQAEFEIELWEHMR